MSPHPVVNQAPRLPPEGGQARSCVPVAEFREVLKVLLTLVHVYVLHGNRQKDKKPTFP